jgi:hypothetical protein
MSHFSGARCGKFSLHIAASPAVGGKGFMLYIGSRLPEPIANTIKGLDHVKFRVCGHELLAQPFDEVGIAGRAFAY